jgi:hypothetical protein
MTRLSGIGRLAPVGAALAVLASVGVLLGGSIVSAQGTTIDGGTWTCGAASTGNVVEITLTDVPAGGLGAADISVAFDSAVLKITACDTGDLDGACNPNAPGGPAQAAGFKAPAITAASAVVATLTFDCVGAAGTSSALDVTVNELVDGTSGDPQPITAAVEDGAVTTGATAMPSTGADGSSSSGASAGWIIPLAVALTVGAVGLGAAGVWRMRRRA